MSDGLLKVLVIAIAWAGLNGLGFLAHFSGHLNGYGIFLLATAGFIVTIFVWTPEGFNKFWK